jgi:hypothetical protein
MGSESRVMISDDFRGESEPSIYMAEVGLCNPCSGDGGVAWDKDCSSGASVVHDCEDSIVFLVWRQPGDKVHGHDLKWSRVGVGAYAVHGCFLLMCLDLALLTGGAALDVFSDPLFHSWPIVSLLGGV